jgi:methane/ammonia monooxygenase subunit A
MQIKRIAVYIAEWAGWLSIVDRKIVRTYLAGSSRAEVVKVSRALDYIILFTAFLFILGGYHIHYMLTDGDWDFWTGWKDKRQWITSPVVVIAVVALVQVWLWGRYRLPWGATVCVLVWLLGEWINRYFNFWGYYGYLPVNIWFPSQLIPSAIVLDVILLLSNNYTFTAIAGVMGWGLIFYPSNWPVIAPFQMRVDYNGMLMTLADLQGYQYVNVRSGAPEYIHMFDKGTLRTFGKDVAPVSAFFSAFMSILIYFLWHFLGEFFSSIDFQKNKLEKSSL